MSKFALPTLPRQHSLLIGLALGSILIYAALARLPTLRGPFVPHYLALYTLAFALYVAAAFVAAREAQVQWHTLLIIGAAALAMRVVLWSTTPILCGFRISHSSKPTWLAMGPALALSASSR